MKTRRSARWHATASLRQTERTSGSTLPDLVAPNAFDLTCRARERQAGASAWTQAETATGCSSSSKERSSAHSGLGSVRTVSLRNKRRRRSSSSSPSPGRRRSVRQLDRRVARVAYDREFRLGRLFRPDANETLRHAARAGSVLCIHFTALHARQVPRSGPAPVQDPLRGGALHARDLALPAWHPGGRRRVRHLPAHWIQL
jgi:hypothetical protein